MDDAEINARRFLRAHPEHADGVRIKDSQVLMKLDAADAFRKWAAKDNPATAAEVEREYRKLLGSEPVEY